MKILVIIIRQLMLIIFTPFTFNFYIVMKLLLSPASLSLTIWLVSFPIPYEFQSIFIICLFFKLIFYFSIWWWQAISVFNC